MRELNVNEIKEVNGGIVHLLGFALAFAGSAGARTLGGYLLRRASLGLATYGLVEHVWGGHKNNN
ncbi:hypothetical protein [Colwellia psychrerythraea]|uniref:Uncharacterized protein n=1 Tax=Colwellia psychrerythraea (strain 34H / ATCC BAA-681) TaxID=167879 RepID=Q47VL6_COLP3|nr:hypothetical protein [Colwellia psychrerythraea]AAZ26713.1 hypothetical protein CPS_4508 [Colwellia psychrerythraea 34H]